MGRSSAAPLRDSVRDLFYDNADCGSLRRSFGARNGESSTGARDGVDVAIGLGWGVHGRTGEARRGALSEGMRFVSWRHLGGWRWRGAADWRDVSFELERPH